MRRYSRLVAIHNNALKLTKLIEREELSAIRRAEIDRRKRAGTWPHGT